ncbi:MAG: phosphate acyltransferase PlsX [Candidatus Humimicrobiaceae bacterium]|jgi:glycerol-3-phosphate acyltransferase PlsX|nr:phosphate acyltransferase PlsX [Candidatus Humimicrobiaceae bacterium]
MLQNNSNYCSIIIDAMGGDFAPDEIIKGSIEAKEAYNVKITLVGDTDKIKKSAESSGISLNGIEIIPAYQEVSMNDSPSEVLKKKKNSSIYIGSQLASREINSAFISAGNTGAVMACSLFNIKRIEGIARPAIAVVIPLGNKKFVLIDAGANMDCKPFYLKQFAIMGKIYSENIIGVKNPKVALVNVGSEEKKGNELTVECYKLLKDCPVINFIGNVEGRELFEGAADVAVCDGFIGNIILKSIEGMADLFFGEIKQILTSSILAKISALGIMSSLKNMKKKFDYEEYGGAQLLGLNRPVIISHGSSKSKSIKNAVKVAIDSIKTDLTVIISKTIKEIN